ncbi:unnamed protein product [Calypogeia fissa]
MAVSTKRAALLLLLIVVATLDAYTGASAASSTVESEASNSERNGEEESKWNTESWRTSQSQGQMLRFLRDRKRAAKVDSVDTKDDSAANRFKSANGAATRGGARRVDEEVELDEDTEIPVQQLKDLVTKLPGQPPVEFAQYAGYVTVNEKAGRALFYYFVEATSSPETKPLVLWLNGGPGCSSLGYGALEELGPFRVNSDGQTLHRNHYSWNKLANIIFLESPAGVGFSYSNTSTDYATSGDNRTASDSLTFLLNWFQRFPQYKYREFYIIGESYGGNYVPQLTQKVYHYNKELENPFMNLKGFMVGNAVIDNDQDQRGEVDYWWTHALISDETYSDLVSCLNSTNGNCTNAVNTAYTEQGNIDPYDIYTPTCLNLTASLRQLPGKFGRFKGYDPCLDNYVSDYLNSPDVQEALHANVTKVSYPWTACSDIIFDDWQDSASTVIPIYQELIAAGLKIWVYSGDVDSVVPVTSTKYSLALLKLKTTVPWYAWYRSEQVGGYTQGYDGLTFVTVRNSGHEVPLFQPARALSLITSYITGKPLPSQ